MQGPEHTVIVTPSGLAELIEHLMSAGRFAFDTEFVSEETYEPVLGLIQVATEERVAAIDPQAVGDLGGFWEVVTGSRVEVMMHAAGEDLRICRLRSGRLPKRVVDLQIAAGLVGLGYPLSLTNLVRHELGITVASGETRTDWRKRPLSAAQLRYALDDVRYLLSIADRLQARLSQYGRAEWAESEYQGLIASVVARSSEEDRWRRLPSLHQLDRRGLEVARRLDGWRREQARRQDRPFRQVLRDDLLVGIAKRQPANKRDLEALRDFNRPHLHAAARELLDIIVAARAVPEEALPELPERFEEGPGQAMVVSLLAAAMSQCCAEQQVATGLVGSSGDLKALIRWHAEGQPSGWRPALLTGWRGDLVGSVLMDLLEGRRSLRIVDPNAEVPVALGPVP